MLCIAVAGITAQWLAWRLRLPAIVLLFAVGVIVGPGLQILRPAEMFGDALRPLVDLAVTRRFSRALRAVPASPARGMALLRP